MNNPGEYSLCDQSVAAALSAVALSPIVDLDGMEAVTIQARFAYGTGGTTTKAYVQTTLDNGSTWMDIACLAFTTATSLKVINLSGMTPVTNAITPTDGAMADNTVQDGVLGTALRVKLTSTGTYATTLLSVKVSAR